MQQLIHRHDPDAEKLVLATLILNPEAFDTPDALFPDEAFYNETHRKLYRAAARVYRDTGCADAHLVAAQARDDGMTDAPIQLWALLTDDTVANSPTFCTAYFPAYARRMRKAYIDREKGKAALQYQQAILDGTDEHEARIILDSLLDALDQMNPIETTDEEILALLGTGARYPTGITRLDTISGGMTKPGLNILAARPSVGKSALARSIIRHAAQRGDTVFWYSVDQSAGQIYELEIAHHLRINTITIRNKTSEELRHAVQDIRTKVWRDRVILIDKPLTLPTLLSHARASAARLIVIDYLQAVDTGIDNEREYDSVTRVSKALKALALEMNTPILALSQLSRGARPGEPPTLAHLRASGQIEQDADQVWGLERDTTTGSNDFQEATLHILKNKTGPTGQITLTWHGPRASYEPHAPTDRYEGRYP